MSQSLSVAKKNVDLIKESAGLVSKRQPLPSFKETNAGLNDLVKKRSDNGKKLIALGTALIIMPDPITGAVGVPLLIGGKMMQRRQSSNIKNIYEEMRSTLNSLSSLGL
ncbi:MAG: hypothetical protein OK457_05200 [Thaumarchaeota archaeon]|nr:hypothetical protein [Nitrososphaerota archaeon]